MKIIKLYGSIRPTGDGEAYVVWFLLKDQAETDQRLLEQCWGGPCIEEIDSFENSKQHQEAILNAKYQEIRKKLKVGLVVLVGDEKVTVHEIGDNGIDFKFQDQLDGCNFLDIKFLS